MFLVWMGWRAGAGSVPTAFPVGSTQACGAPQCVPNLHHPCLSPGGDSQVSSSHISPALCCAELCAGGPALLLLSLCLLNLPAGKAAHLSQCGGASAPSLLPTESGIKITLLKFIFQH